jgi:hypothetical protein
MILEELLEQWCQILRAIRSNANIQFYSNTYR